MNRRSIAALMCAILLCATSAAWAHPPKSVTITCSGGTVKVTVSHNVDDPAKHYVEKIVIMVDGKPAAKKEYTSQSTPDTFTETFSINAPNGAKVKAEVSCVIMGQTSAETTAN